jgi:N-acetyl-anhydromuramyl-L-alanine amidase AmpD
VAPLFVESPNVTHTTGRRIDLLVVHTAETAERAGAALAVAKWFARRDSEVSAHYCVDDRTVVQCVRERYIAWHARGANASSIGIELAGFAGQSAAEWDDRYSRAVLARAAELGAEVCGRHRLPVVWLRPAELRGGRRGVTGHADVSAAFKRSDHWDPGPAFPVDRFLALVRQNGV